MERSLASFSSRRSRVVLVGTWAHTANYYDVQFPLNDKFEWLASKSGVTLAPVGKYWLYVHIFAPTLAMRLTTDGLHPSIEGSYLASCIIYRSIYNRQVYLGRRPRTISKANFYLFPKSPCQVICLALTIYIYSPLLYLAIPSVEISQQR